MRVAPGALMALAALGLASQAAGQVFEIGTAGAVIVHDAPAVYDTAGSRPILPAPASKRRRSIAAQPRDRIIAGSDVIAAADAAELSPALVEAVAWAESRHRARVISRAGAIGEMQLMPRTARALGVDPRESRQNYHGGAAYLRQLLARYDGDVVRALAAYDAGPGAVDRYAGTPPYPETRAYVAAILERLSRGAGDLAAR